MALLQMYFAKLKATNQCSDFFVVSDNASLPLNMQQLYSIQTTTSYSKRKKCRWASIKRNESDSWIAAPKRRTGLGYSNNNNNNDERTSKHNCPYPRRYQTLGDKTCSDSFLTVPDSPQVIGSSVNARWDSPSPKCTQPEKKQQKEKHQQQVQQQHPSPLLLENLATALTPTWVKEKRPTDSAIAMPKRFESPIASMPFMSPQQKQNHQSNNNLKTARDTNSNSHIRTNTHERDSLLSQPPKQQPEQQPSTTIVGGSSGGGGSGGGSGGSPRMGLPPRCPGKQQRQAVTTSTPTAVLNSSNDLPLSKQSSWTQRTSMISPSSSSSTSTAAGSMISPSTLGPVTNISPSSFPSNYCNNKMAARTTTTTNVTAEVLVSKRPTATLNALRSDLEKVDSLLQSNDIFTVNNKNLKSTTTNNNNNSNNNGNNHKMGAVSRKQPLSVANDLPLPRKLTANNNLQPPNQHIMSVS